MALSLQSIEDNNDLCAGGNEGTQFMSFRQMVARLPLLVVLVSPSFAHHLEENRNFGGLWSFGIEFSPVSDEVVKSFWQAYDNPNGFTRGLQEGDRVNPYNGPLNKESKVRNILANATAQYFLDARQWIKLKCAIPNMSSLVQSHRLEFTEATKLTHYQLMKEEAPSDKEGAAEFYDKLSKKYPLGTIGNFWRVEKDTVVNEVPLQKCVFERPRAGNESGVFEKLDSEVIAGEDWEMAFDENSFFVEPGSSMDNFGMYNGVPHLLEVSAGLAARQKSKAEVWPGTSKTRILFQVVDNWLIPFRTHDISKGFSVPVARFDPQTGEIEAYYDFGLLVLRGLPQDNPVILSSVMEAARVEKFRTDKNPRSVGALGTNDGQMNTYLKASEFPVRTKFWNYDRIPVGSIHFMANAIWHDPQMSSSRDALLVKISARELEDLYMNNSAWINVYDHVQKPEASLNPRYSPFNLENAFTGECLVKPQEAMSDTALIGPRNTPLNMWISHEIIIGGEEGRRKVLEESDVRTMIDFNCLDKR